MESAVKAALTWQPVNAGEQVPATSGCWEGTEQIEVQMAEAGIWDLEGADQCFGVSIYLGLLTDAPSTTGRPLPGLFRERGGEHLDGCLGTLVVEGN